MNAFIYSHKTLIGTTTFNQSFGSMGHILGGFIPSNEYQLIKTAVQEFNSATEKDYKKWYALRFNIQLENGYFLLPIGGVEIFDHREFPEELLELSLAGVQSQVYNDFFIDNKPFLTAPWQPLTIDQKIDLEDALFRTIGETNVTFSALAKHGSNGEVLFNIHGDNCPPFVIASLKAEEATMEEIFPEENYFHDFELVRDRMAKG